MYDRVYNTSAVNGSATKNEVLLGADRGSMYNVSEV